MKPWQRGFELPYLREIADRFRDEEDGRIIGRFVGVDERWVAERLAESRLFISDGGCIAIRQAKARSVWKAHGSRPLPPIEPGHFVVERFCGSTAAALDGLGSFRRSVVALQSPLPHLQAHELAAALGLFYAGSKVPAGGEIIGMWHRQQMDIGGPLNERQPEALNFVGPLAAIDTGPLWSQLDNVELPWAQHYSGYNKRSSWTALSLRGFGPVSDIEKPAEMSKKWKTDHPGWQDLRCRDTELRGWLPEVEPILEQLGAFRPERVRLMRLAPGDGELTRHADITDVEAGLRPGELARIHVPLRTNPNVVFTGWRLEDGSKRNVHMPVGEAWALDHTKPHAALNGGDDERIHLVFDTPVEGKTKQLLRSAAEAI